MPVVIVGLVVTADFVSADPASAGAEDLCGITVCGKTVGDGTHVGLSEAQTRGLPKEKKERVTDGGKTAVRAVPLQYETTLACPANIGPEDVAGCTKAYTACEGVPHTTGPLVRIRFRTVLPANKFGDWASAGETCYPDLVPNNKAKPQLTVEMIRSEFSKTPFTKPNVAIEPVGNRTLVNLATYFTAAFPAEGYGPDEVRTVTLLGHRVQIKPVFKTANVVFGDGTSSGPVATVGGGYPDGDIRHTYTKRGSVNTRATVVYSGQFAVDDGQWADLPGTATITGPVQPLQVLEATTRLVR